MEESEKADSEPIPTNDDASPSQGKSCTLCGCATPAVRCDRCNSQIFCLSCDDMYHRHPKRKLHLRKAVDSIWTTARSPRLRRRTELPGDPCKIPIPPPRSKKRDHRTIGARTFLKSGLELGSFGHSKVFSPASKDFFAGQKSPASMVESNCDDGTPSPNIRSESGQIYENDNVIDATGNLDDRSPWNPRPNIASPIQVSIPSSSPDIVANGQSFGYPAKPHSQSAADLPTHTGHPIGHHPYHFHPPYPYMHPPMHPYSHSMAHLNCAQCISSSWSNLISPHPSPYFHPMPWGSAQNTLSRPPIPGQPGPMKLSHGDLSTHPDSGFHFPYPGAPYYHNGPPVVDPNFIKDLHEQAEMQKQRKEAKSSPRNEEMDVATNPSPMAPESSSSPTAVTSTEPVASTAQDAQTVEETPAVPVKPTEPWSCVHCTFINPPGIHICQVCCKTSYGNKPLDSTEEQIEDRPDSRDTDSPLINRDALMNSPGVSEIREAQKDIDVPVTTQASAVEYKEQQSSETSTSPIKLTTETQTFTTTKTTDVQTQNITRKSIASSTDSIFPKQEISVQTEIEALTKHCTVATDPMISSQSLESLLSGVSAPPYHNRRAGWGRGATSFSTQSLYERGRSRSPMPRSLSFHTEAPTFASEEVMHSASQAWLYADPMYYKPHNQVLGQALTKEDYFDGTWGSMDRLNHRVKHKKDKEKLDVRPKFHRSLDDLKSEKKPEFIRTHELMMLQTVKEAERCGFTLEDLHVAYLHCGKENPVFWLEDNWPQMIKNVIGLAAKYGEENEENDVGAITTTEAKEALRIHRGDIWDAVAECIETRQRKILELTVRGNFTQKQIAETLKNNEGNVELAYADLLRASTKRHKFILSPGLSTDSEDLNVYNPTEDSATDHNISLSPMKAAKLDAAAESKSEKKKSDFLTKLTAIREAQSERRKAREEKELIRETITQDIPISAGSEDMLKEKNMSIELTPSISREDSKEVEEILEGGISETVETISENKLVEDASETKEIPHPKETVEDNIPVDFDTNWSESQGEWIEEYSDEHWEEGDEHWVGLGKKFQKMQKEFEEEAMQMAALWEKEELEDDVFEEETKVQQEGETVTDNDKKFNDWVKANLKVDSVEYEEEFEMKGKPQEGDITTISLKERLELEGSQPSPLQHYPTALDLSLKSQFESDWVDLPADAEIEKLAHDIVCEGSDIENKFDEAEMVMYEEEKHSKVMSDQGSDEDWERIEIDEQLQEVNELDNFAFPEKEGEIERKAEEEMLNISYDGTELSSEITSEITIEKDATVLYKNIESIKDINASDVGIISTESIDDTKTIIEQPKVPVRRKSKLSSTDMDEVLKNQPTVDISSDIPPPLPEKTRPRTEQPIVRDIYAVPDKTTKVSKFEDHISEEFDKDVSFVPSKPPRLNLSPTSPEENILKKSDEGEEIPQKVLTKEGSPITSLSYESDSNFFADSESESEIKLHRPKSVHKKLTKYENEVEESKTKDVSIEKLAKRTVKEKKDISESPLDLEVSQEKLEKEDNDILESNFDLELDEDIDPSLIEPLPRMKDIDYDPELPILLGGRGRQLSDVNDVNAPKAFREDTTRPLQLFKAVKKEIPADTINLATTAAVQSPTNETSFMKMISDELPLPATNIPYETSTKLKETLATETKTQEVLYYNDSLIPQQNLTDSQMLQEEALRKEEIENETKSAVQPTPVAQEDEMNLTEIEAFSAVADYFFGRYNEITVTPPKKKTPAKPRPPTPSNKMPSKIMSSSEISSVPHTESIPQMDLSSSAVLQEKTLQKEQQDISVINISEQQKEVLKESPTESTPVKEVIPPPEKPKQPVPTECLTFAEDYLFGCYNQVVPPRKTKNVPVISAKIPKLGEIVSLSRPQSPLKDQKPITPISTPEPPPELPVGEQEQLMLEDEIPEDDENDTSVRTDTSAIYDDIFHDLPPEMLSNQSFDESSIYYESFQDAVEDAQGNSVIDASVVNVRAKSVHFEEPKTPVVPPRRNKVRSAQKTKVPSSADSSESYANEYLYRQYEQASQAKKKLPLCSGDFRMNQGFEPAEIPSDTSLTPEEEEEEIICSETSVEIPSKLKESPKSSFEYDFKDSEQPLDIETDTIQLKHKDSEILADDSIPQSEINLLSEERNLKLIASNIKEDDISADIQSENFEGPSVSDNLERITESSHISKEFSPENNEAFSDHLHVSPTECSIISVQQAQSYDTISNETSNQIEIDQFVFIEQGPDIIDDSYNLYDIQDSLVCDLNYVDIKGNIEDECTDDSEQEWKRNEDRKNTLNASFLTNASISKVPGDDKKSEQFNQIEKLQDKSQETDFAKTQTSDLKEIDFQKFIMDESTITESHDGRESAVNEDLAEDFDFIETIKEDIELPKQAEGVHMESELNIIETHDDEQIKITEEMGMEISSASDELYLISARLPYDSEKMISEEVLDHTLESSQDVYETTSSIDDEFQILSESITTENFEKLSEKIDENLQEIEKELFESESYISEYDDIISEELNVMSSVSELDNLISVKEKVKLEPSVEGAEFSESIDKTMAEEIKLETSKGETEIQKTVDMKQEETVLESSFKLDFEVSETSDLVIQTDLELESSKMGLEITETSDSVIEKETIEISETSDTVTEKETNLESLDETIYKSDVVDEDKFLSVDQPFVLEDFEASEELSDDNLSTHSSVSTQIAVSMKVTLKESEGDECSLNLEQIDNFDEDNETSSTHFIAVSTQEMKSNERNVSEDSLELQKDQAISDVMFLKEHRYETEKVKTECPIELEENRNELTPVPSIMNESYTNVGTQERILEEYASEENLKVKVGMVGNENKMDHVADEYETTDTIEIDKLKDYTSSPENVEPKIIEPVESESQSNELGNDEIEALMAEECIMSHFYDEWYKSETSTDFSFLSAESIYAKYGNAESSESGNESDIDNALNAVDSKGMSDETVTCKSETSLDSPFLRSEIKGICHDSEETLLKDNMIEESKSDIINASQESYTLHSSKIKNESDISSDFSVELELKSLKNNQQLSEKTVEECTVTEETEISSFAQEKAESITLQADAEILMHSAKEQEILGSTTVNNKFSTSKSCQTEDSFEEDVFFDSFDDTFTIPSYIHLPIETQEKPPTTDISIQCELISIEDILSSKKIITVSQTEVISTETTALLSKEDSPGESKLRGQEPKVTELTSEEKEESSSESFEDSDSDIFIESPSSQDELDVGVKRGLLYAEIDSDTGFSSGSECGWTRKSDYKQKEFKKPLQISSSSKIISLQTSTSSNEEKEIALSIESSIHDNQEKNIETFSISEEKMASDIIESKIEILPDDARSSCFPAEIVERAITPVAIPQFPSFEDDLMFVELKETDDEITDNTEEEMVSATSTTPTVEYFYGPLPDTVKIDPPPYSSEMFYETASELSESASFSVGRTDSLSDSTSSLATAGRVSFDSNIDNKVASIVKGSEDESFSETISSLKGETEDSISEYYSFPDSNISLISRPSLAESDIFDFAQNEMFTDEFLIDTPTHEESKEKFDISVSKKEMDDLAILDKLDDIHTKESPSITSVTEAKQTVSCDISQVAECEKSFDDLPAPEKKDEFMSIHKSDSSDNVKKYLSEEECISSSAAVLYSKESPDVESTECEPVLENIIKSSSDVPPVPSDIVRYLYYDDSITFDDESYHTQSGSIDIPSLTSEESKPTDSINKLTIEAKEKASGDDDVCSAPAVESINISEEKITILAVETEGKVPSPNDKSAEKSTKMHVQDIQEIPDTLESSEEKNDSTAIHLSDNVIDFTEEIPGSEVRFPENIQSSPETHIKFPSIEVLPSESIAVLPSAAEQTFETVVYKEEEARESVIVSDTSFEVVSSVSENNKLEDTLEPTVLKPASPDVPPVPSDIVRYLYYSDDISFSEMTESSFHSQYENELENVHLPVETVECPALSPTVSLKPEILQDVSTISHKLSSDLQDPCLTVEADAQQKPSFVSHEESFYKSDTSCTKDESQEPLDSSECFEDWFDIRETSDLLKHRDSEQYSSTRSSALKEDSEPPCIPEYILSPKLSSGVPMGKNDVDEVTDISTHFTMTDDSDRFSDIENDISLNFEDECVLPIQFSDQLQDDEFFESCVKSEDVEIDDSDIENAENEFQFLTPDQLKIFPEQEENIKLISSEEVAAELPKALLKESVASPELSEQKIYKETKLEFTELIEKTNMKVTSADSSECFKEQFTDSLPVELNQEKIDQQNIIHELKEKSEDIIEKFEECITSTSEVSKEEFAQCLTSVEVSDEQIYEGAELKFSGLKEESDKCITSADSSELYKQQHTDSLHEPFTNKEIDEQNITFDVEKKSKDIAEKIDESITSVSEVSKEEFAECPASLKLSDGQFYKEIDLEFSELKEESQKNIVSIDSSDLFKEQITDSSFVHLDNEKINQQHMAHEFKEKLDDLSEKFDECGSSISEASKEEFLECLTSSELVDEKLDKNVQDRSNEIFNKCSLEVSKEQSVESLSSSKLSDNEKKEDIFKIIHESSPKELSVSYENIVSDENGNFPETTIKQDIVLDTTQAKDFISSEILEMTPSMKISESFSTDKIDEVDNVCVSLEHTLYSEPSQIIPEKEELLHKEIKHNLEQIETPEAIKDNLETSYTSPIDESHSIATEVSESWCEADDRYFEEDESIYDIPLEDLNVIHSDICITKESEEKLMMPETKIIDSESFSNESNAPDLKRTDILSFESPAKEIKETDIKITETIKSTDLKSDSCKITNNLNYELIENIENQQFQISQDYSNESDKIFEEIKMPVSEEATKPFISEERDIFMPDTSSQQDLKQSHESLLSSNMKLIHEVKLETESEISSTVKEKINVECVSTTSGAEPAFFPAETVHDSQEVQMGKISSKEVCLQEEIITSSLTQASALETSPEVKITSGTTSIESEMVNDDLEDSNFKTMEVKSVETLDSEISEYISVSDSSKSYETTSDIISPKEKELVLEIPDVESSENVCKSSVTSTIQTDMVKFEREDVNKNVEIIDSKRDVSKIGIGEDNVSDTSIETLPTSYDFDLKEQVHFSKLIDNTEFSSCETESNIGIEEKIVSVGHKSETSVHKSVENFYEETVKKDVTFGTQSASDIVDFKGSTTIDEEICFKMEETTAVISKESNLKNFQDDKSIFTSDSIVSSEIVDFKGELTIDELSNKAEAIHKKSDTQMVSIDKKGKTSEISHESFEIVDFKLITSLDKTEMKNEHETLSFKSNEFIDEKIDGSKKLDLALNEREGPFETFDFKGQVSDMPESEKINIGTSDSQEKCIFNEKVEISREEKDLKFMEYEKSLPVEKEETACHKIDYSETYEVVDFKGQTITDHDKPMPIIEKIAEDEITHTTETREFDKNEKSLICQDSKQINVFETVDFKGCLSADELKMQTRDKAEEVAMTIQDPLSKKLDSNIIMSSQEIVDFKSTICLDSETEIFPKQSEAVIYDSEEVSYSFPGEQEYNYNIDKQVVMFDPRETYGYSFGLEEQALDNIQLQNHQLRIAEENKVLESEQRTYDEVIASEAVSFATSTEESGDLYTCAETLSAASDTSLQFHSFSHDFEETLNISTSEDFTDVASHLTSTENSDKWSDVEGDFSLEDVEFDRDKTPTRAPYEDLATKEELKTNVQGIQSSENVTEFIRESSIVLDNEKHVTSTSQVITSEPESIKEIKQEISTIEETNKSEISSSLIDIDREFKLHSDKQMSCTSDLTILQQIDDTEQVSIDTDVSMITVTEDITDLSSYMSVEGSESLSSSEHGVEKQVKESEICVIDTAEQSEKVISETETADNNFKIICDVQIEKDEASTLLEHFADIKSIKDSLTTAVPFSPFDTEQAIQKMHEDITSEISSQPEKPKSELGLEAETEHSISELSEDIAVCIEKDGETKFIYVDYEKPVEYTATINEPSGTPHTSTTSTSSSYSDFENSDHASDTYADISLQGATTESSDKWSDFETEDVLYDDIEIPETVEITDFSQLIMKTNENKLVSETTSSESNLKIGITSSEIKMDSKEVEIALEEKSDLSKDSEFTSIKTADFSSDNKSDFEQTISATEVSVLPSLSSSRVTVGLSDEEFTDVTPLEITTETSDKLSDISDDTSFGEIDEGSASLKANLIMEDQELAKVSDKCEAVLDYNLKESKNIDKQLKVSAEDSFIENISTQSNVQLKSKSGEISFEISEIEKNIPVEVCEKIDHNLSINVEKLDKVEVKSSLSGNIKMKSIDILSQSSDSSSITSSEADKQDTIKLTKNLKDILNESKESEQSLVPCMALDNAMLQNIKVSSKSVDSFSAEICEIHTPPAETSMTDSLSKIQKSDNIAEESKYGLSKVQLSQTIEDSCDSGLKLNFDTKVESLISEETEKIELTQQTELERTTELHLKDKDDVEDTSSCKITDDSETLDNFTDVPTHTITSETSDAYLDLESDHSFEEIDNLQVEAERVEFQVTMTEDVPSMDTEFPRDTNHSEYYENSVSQKDIVENADDFILDSIPENELENYEEEEYSLSEHFEISEDELIYPLPYNDDWIEQSFELKEYGVEAEFFESESDIHGLGVTHEDYDDEDIQRAIDYNLSNFEDNEADIENVNTTESFKTLSQDVSPHLKPDEYDTWSTADAPSIEEDFAEQDDILSKIDEILAEDFSDLSIYQTGLYLKQDEEMKEHVPKDIPAPSDKDDGFIQSDKVSLAKFDSEIPQKATKLDKIETDSKSPHKTDSEIISDEKIMQKDSSYVLKTRSDSVGKDASAESKTSAFVKEIHSKIDSELVHKVHSESVSDKNIQETVCEVSENVCNIQFSDTSVDKNAVKVSKAESTSLSLDTDVMKDSVKTITAVSEVFSDELTIKRDSGLVPKSDSTTIIDEIVLKKSIDEVSKIEPTVSSSELTLEKDSMKESIMKSDSIETADKKKSIETLKTESKAVSSEINIKDVSKSESKSDSKTIVEDITLKKTLEKTSEKELNVISYEKTSEEDFDGESKIISDLITTEAPVKKDFKDIHKSETLSSEISIKKVPQLESKLDSEMVSDEKTLKKTSDKDLVSKSKIKSDSLTSDTTVTKECMQTLKTDSESISAKINKTKSDSETLSHKVIQKKTSEKDFEAESDIESYEVILEKDFVSESKIKSESSEIAIKKDYEEIPKCESEVISSTISLLKESKSEVKPISETASDEKRSLIKDSETLKELKQDSSRMSDEVSKTTYKIDSKIDSGVSSENTFEKESIRETKHSLDSVSDEIIIKTDLEQTFNLKQDLAEKDKFLLKSTDKIPEEQVSSITKLTADQNKILDQSSEISVKSKDISSLTGVSTAVISPSVDSDETSKNQFSDILSPSVSSADSSTDIPLTKSNEAQKEPSLSGKISKETEITESSTDFMFSESLKHSIKSTSESIELQTNIPDQTICKDEAVGVFKVADTVSKEQTLSDSLMTEVKPDIPKKTKRKSLDLTETSSIKEESDKKPSLPPKKSKRHSLTDSASSSLSGSLSSSSSVESIGSFESAVSDKSGKSSLKSSDEPSMHSLSPEAPTRRSRSSRTSSSRSASRDSEDNSSCSRSSSLKIRRRSSNFAEPEPIDLSKKRASIDERMKKLQIEGKCTTKEKAFIAAKLIEMQFEEEDALLASRQCNTVYHAVKFLTQLCDMCNCRFPINLMSSLVNCTHRACKECLRAHFTSLLYDRSVFTLLCPICHKPDITDQNIQEYFTHLDMTLRNILEDKVYDLFQRKLRDEVLTKDPNFHWCSQCSSGFIASPRLKKLYCPDCSAITCAMCHQTWELEHEGVHCERFQQWKDMHTPEPPPAGLVKFLTDRGISCPSCGLVYAQACGGCMLYKCSHCSFEFCGFCIRPLKKGRECSNEICDSRGHHIHHIHNCLFFLRDKDITEIQMLLEEESITYYTIPPKNQIVKTRCQVREQKNNHGILTEDRCGRPIEPYCGGLCRTHYYEYLAELLRKNNISPLSIMTIQDLQFMLRKSRIFVPEKVKGETSEDYYDRLLEFVTKSLT